MNSRLSIGQVLGNRYEVQQFIGEGGMARVYRGLDRRLSRPVILKVLRAELASNDEFLRRFELEAHRSAQLAHSNIIKVFDVDTEQGIPYIVMEYYGAEDLRAILEREGRFPLSRVLEIANPVLDALDYAHAQGIIHRDLKPHNILLTERREVKITDFGIAKALTGDSLTRTGSMVGSAHYFSPEQAQGQPVAPTADIYSLGVVLYELLTGRVPFEGDNPVVVGLKHVQEEPPPLSMMGATVPPAVEAVVMKALRKLPADRFQDARSFWLALHAAVGSGRLEGPPVPTLPAPHPPPAPPSPGSASAAASHRASPGLEEASVRAGRGSGSGGREKNGCVPPNGHRAGASVASRPNPGRTSWVVALFVFTLLVGSALGVLYYSMTANLKVVPDVQMLLGDAARVKVEKEGLRLVVKETQYNGQYPTGTVLSQSPAPGTKLRRGDDVSVVLSMGKQMVQVPNLGGLDRDAATKALESLSLAPRWREQYSDTVAAGLVVSQEPAAGTAVDLKAQVAVVISKGLPMVTVPDVAGRTEKEAREQLERVGLDVSLGTGRSSPTVPKDKVLEQKPAKGARVTKGTTVQVVLSTGPEMRRIPALAGMTLAKARAAATQAGIRDFRGRPRGRRGQRHRAGSVRGDPDASRAPAST